MNQTQTEPVAPLMNDADQENETARPRAHTARVHGLPVLFKDGKPLVEAAYPVPNHELSTLENWFTHHPPTPEQVRQYETLRDEGHRFAAIVTALVPPCADRTAAIRKIREAVMTANAAIACGGR